MKISIITVCLNSEKTIEQTIKSVLEQQYKDLEYIIVDGGSTDGTMDIVKKYDITRVISEPDNGLYDAMNKGIAIATGDVIGIINSDDWYEPNVFNKVAECFQHGNIELTYGKTNYVSNNKIIGVQVPAEPEAWHYEVAFMHPTVFVKREIYNKYGVFDTTYKIAADCDFLLRLVTQKVTMEYIDEIIVNYRTNGLSAQQSDLGDEEFYKIKYKYLSFVLQEEQQDIVQKIENHKVKKQFMKRLYNADDNLSELMSKIGDQKVVIYGAGKWGKQTLIKLRRNHVEPTFFVDSNKEKWETVQEGVKIKSPQALESFAGVVLVMVSKQNREIVNELENMNNQNLKCVTWGDI